MLSAVPVEKLGLKEFLNREYRMFRMIKYVFTIKLFKTINDNMQGVRARLRPCLIGEMKNFRLL